MSNISLTPTSKGESDKNRKWVTNRRNMLNIIVILFMMKLLEELLLQNMLQFINNWPISSLKHIAKKSLLNIFLGSLGFYDHVSI